MSANKKLPPEFFLSDCLTLAPNLIGKLLCRKLPDGQVLKLRIDETEAYNGIQDSACHASKGKTPRTQVMWNKGGSIYVYLIYGMYWLLNIVSNTENNPEAVLIRSCKDFNGPGKLTKYLQIDKSFYGLDIADNDLIWLEDDGYIPKIITGKRVNINYADDYYKNILWRFIDKS